ncbi:hypothetical protein Mag101_07300 [Microbulbifer agarilyticus]|uniref:Uncharacterized protein n=1 Tax=Microbulbifer agarilyticus TaxID=260552 RepID=A0A1Q2M407_9GAMM|nr:hypothetical protein [Microbulbifer agarilyticus]AQQ67464.1 hypothetical protein Mag101_07300 [Microbulbifer agarilyticus]
MTIHRAYTTITRMISVLLPVPSEVSAGDMHAVQMACERAHTREEKPLNRYTRKDPRHPYWERHAERIRLRGTHPREVQEG